MVLSFIIFIICNILKIIYNYNKKSITEPYKKLLKNKCGTPVINTRCYKLDDIFLLLHNHVILGEQLRCYADS